MHDLGLNSRNEYMFKKVFGLIRAFMDLGRVHGISTTASMALIGALTSTGSLEWQGVLGIILVSCFAHAAPAAYMELNDVELDSHILESSRKPLVCGRLSKKDAKIFIIVGLALSFTLAILFFPNLPMLMALFLSAVWVMWYCSGFGKRMLFSYDFSFAVAYAFYGLFGALAIGNPTVYTWIFMGCIALEGGMFAQWENGLKDVDADRGVGIRSFAASLNISSGTTLTFFHPYFVYGLCIKILFLILCFIAYLQFVSTYYFIFLLLYGIPSQIYIMWRFLTKHRRLDRRKTILMDVPLSAILGFSVVVGKVGIIPVILVILFLIGGYLKGSLWEGGTEFKFMRYVRQTEIKGKKI